MALMASTARCASMPLEVVALPKVWSFRSTNDAMMLLEGVVLMA